MITAYKRLGNTEGQSKWRIQRNWQQWVHKTQDEEKPKENIRICGFLTF
jgi:hypothetical protein